MSVHLLLAASWLDPFVWLLWQIVQYVNVVVHNLGASLIILAALIRAVFWGLNVKQFKAMLSMQRIAPRLKQIQERYKGDQQRIQQETMAMYREAGVNPLAGCLPMLVQLPILYSVYWVVLEHKALFDTTKFLWIGTSISTQYPQVFATSLAAPDVVLLALYAGSMYFSMRYGSVPSTDEQQAQMQRIMAIFSPLLLAYFGWRAHWPSAMILYWFSYNAFTMAQQVYMLRRYHQPLSALDSAHTFGEEDASKQAALGNGGAKSVAALPKGAIAGNGAGDENVSAQSDAPRRRRRKKKKRR